VAALAALPWYDFQELHPFTDALWQRVRRLLGCDNLPTELDRTMSCEQQWRHPNLLLGQACGYDAILPWRGQLQVIAAPKFDVPGCEGHHYRSLVVVRRDAPYQELHDLAGARCVINSRTSHSGMNCLRSLVAPLARDGRFFSSVAVSGAHEISVEMVSDGRADVAAIDCVTFALLQRHRPGALSDLRILYRTPLAPAPPFVTRASASAELVAELCSALAQALPEPALGLTGIENVAVCDYQPIADLERRATALGYAELPGEPSGPAVLASASSR
jgi:ABC-type phosphate/phosphonate transport system substrate-binding protein